MVAALAPARTGLGRQGLDIHHFAGRRAPPPHTPTLPPRFSASKNVPRPLSKSRPNIAPADPHQAPRWRDTVPRAGRDGGSQRGNPALDGLRPYVRIYSCAYQASQAVHPVADELN